MPNEIPLPDDLKHLVEKRSGEDRRQSDRRPKSPVTAADRRTSLERRRRTRRRKKGNG
jgi:hypothetical protein